MPRTRAKHHWNQYQMRGPRYTLPVMHHVVSRVLNVICLCRISTHSQNLHETQLHGICYAACCIFCRICHTFMYKVYKRRICELFKYQIAIIFFRALKNSICFFTPGLNPIRRRPDFDFKT